MKIPLKDYQTDAVTVVLKNLKKARKRWRDDADRHAFSLTAATGSGKTVMAAAVFEALFHGDDGFDFDRDPGAVVIWFSDDPALNEQTRFRLMESSDRLRHTDLVKVENTFHREKFDAGKIYFLNTQKLTKSSLLTRGFDAGEDENAFPQMRPDLRGYTIWDTIKNTIEDPALTLYLMLDEAHRGMGNPHREKSTIVKRLINGERGVPGIPIVWGISATIERFKKAIEGMQGHSTLPPVTVDPEQVKDSGLLKDTIVLDIPEGPISDIDTVLVRRAADKLRASSQAWTDYANEQEDGESVVPLMVLQVPNTPNHDEIGKALQTIFQQYPEIDETAVAHVLGSHTPEQFGSYTVEYIEPQRVQNDTWVRVLIAKEAISIGWDCPRAEVMVSFRPANDQTYIAQMLGRMVRTPLARRIAGNDQLNAVDCLLPKFNRDAVENVIKALSDGSGETPPTGRIIFNPVEMTPNPDVPESVWEKFVSLPAQTRPQSAARPAIRLTALAQELVMDGLLSGAGGKAHAAMHKFLDAFIQDRADEFEAKRALVTTVNGRTVIADLTSGETQDQRFQVDADEAVVTDAYSRTARIISRDIARTYTMERAKRMPQAEDDIDDALMDAHEDVAALHLMENLQVLYDPEAEKLSDAWFAKYHDKIMNLPHDRQDAYRQIVALSKAPKDVKLVRPQKRLEHTKIREQDGTEKTIPAYKKHLLCDEKGDFPTVLGGWEKRVLSAEMDREGFQYWYRNPAYPSQDSLGIAYISEEEVKIVRPDFIFFAKQGGKIVADIIDPHGHHLADALPKLKGLAQYAETHAKMYRRIEAISEAGGNLRVLDMTREEVREAIREAVHAESSAKSLYESAVAGDFA